MLAIPEVLLFDAAAALCPDRRCWLVPLHAWVFEQSPHRLGLIAALREALELGPDAEHAELFHERARRFAADDESWKAVRVRIEGRRVRLPLTDFEGHSRHTWRLRKGGAYPAGARLRAEGELRGEACHSTPGRIELRGPTGLTVISDIDDTVKETAVADPGELVRNTFLRPFRPVVGMPELYRRWSERGADFHYVSSSPWQLQPQLKAFFEDAGIPWGPMELKTFSATLGRFAALFTDPVRTKLPAVLGVLRAWPARRFVLVGDSGEKDPELYAEAWRRRPDQVARVFVRLAPGGNNRPERFEEVFAGLPRSGWQVFEDPDELELPDPL